MVVRVEPCIPAQALACKLPCVPANQFVYHCSGMCAGISAIRVHYDTDDAAEQVTNKMWHALVASTLGTDIRLCLCSNPFAPGSVLAAPLHAELVQRLTALHICVANASEVAAVHSLTALRHLQLCTVPDSGALLFGEAAGNGAQPCQMSSLRTLQLHGIPPAAFFNHGSAAGLRRLQAMRLHRCQLPDGCMPAELLRLPALRHFEIYNVSGQQFTMPDLRGLSALQSLAVYRGPCLRIIRSNERCKFGGQFGRPPAVRCDGLDEAPPQQHKHRLAGMCGRYSAFATSEAIACGLGYDTCSDAAFWAANLQRQLRGRCNVQPAPPSAHWSIGWALTGDWLTSDQ
jgi:hypothetical protein